jgi:hypothetical protein
MTNRVVLAYALEKGWNAHVADFDAAFLNANVTENLYIAVPEGLQQVVDKNKFVLKLNKAAYGIVQAPREWQKTLSAGLVEVGFEQSKVDTCLFFLFDDDGCLIGMVTAYVDDMLIVGTERVIAGIKIKLRRKFSMKDLGPIQKLLGVTYKLEVDESTQNKYWRVSLEDYLQKLYDETKIIAEKLQLDEKLYDVPATSGKGLSYDVVSDVLYQFEYRRCVGKLLFGMRKAWPHVCSCVRELSMHLDHPTRVHWRAAWQVVQFLHLHKDLVLRIMKPTELRVTAYVDASFAIPGESRKSVAGIIVTIRGSLVQWISKMEGTVALSSTEAEYIAMSMCGQEVKFVTMLLKEMNKEGTKLPAIICEDNTGAIFLGENSQIGHCSKHINTRYHFIREMIKQGEVQVVYVSSDQNVADLCTKNLARDRYTTLATRILHGDLGRIRREDVRNIVDSVSVSTENVSA